MFIFKLPILLFFKFREDTNEDRIRTFTVRSEHYTGWMDIIAPLVMPVCQLYDLLMYGKMKVELILESGRSNHEAEVVKVQVLYKVTIQLRVG